MKFKIFEYNVDTKIVDISDTESNPVNNKCYKHFSDLLKLDVKYLGWEIDSDGNRLGLFTEDTSSIQSLLDYLKLKIPTEVKHIVALGIFKDKSGKTEFMIISSLFDNDQGFEKTGINRSSYLLSNPEKVNYELFIECDISKFISKEDIEKIRLENSFEKSSLSHVKVDSSGKLLKIYFIEFYS